MCVCCVGKGGGDLHGTEQGASKCVGFLHGAV